MEAASISKEGIRPTGCDEVVRARMPYEHKMSGFGDVRALQGTASPPGQAWGPFPDGAEGGQVPATQVSETWYHVCRRRSSLTPLDINNLGSTGLLSIFSTSPGSTAAFRCKKDPRYQQNIIIVS